MYCHTVVERLPYGSNPVKLLSTFLSVANHNQLKTKVIYNKKKVTIL